MKVSEIMSRTLICVHESDLVSEAERLITEKDIGGVPVLDNNGQLVGLVSKTDLTARRFRPRIVGFLGDEP